MRLAWAVWGLALAPLALLAVATCVLWVDVPFWDQFTVVDLLRKRQAGELGIADLWAQHNEHRFLVPRLVMLALAPLTGWNTLYEGLSALVLFAVAFVLLARSLQARSVPAWTVVPIGALLFSTASSENWLWGFQLCNPLCLLGVILALLALAQAERRGVALAVAVLAGTVATYSFGTGLLVWPVGALLLVAQPAARRSRNLVVWCLCGGLVAGSYFLAFEVGEATHMAGRPSVVQVARFVLAQLGGLLFPHAPAAATAAGAVGVLLLALVVALFAAASPDRRRLASPFLALAAFSVAAALLVGLGRAGAKDFHLRYLPFLSGLWIAVVSLPLVLLPRRSVRIAQGVLGLLVSVAVLANVPADLRDARAHSARLAGWRDQILRGEWDQSLRLYPKLSLLVDYLVFLKRERLSLFRGHDEAREPLRPATDCGLVSRYDRERGELELRCPAFAGRPFRCLFSLAAEPPVRLPDGRSIPLAMDALYGESANAASACFAGHHATFDASGAARVAIRLPGAQLHAVPRIYFSVHLVATDVAFSIGTICRADSFAP